MAQASDLRGIRVTVASCPNVSIQKDHTVLPGLHECSYMSSCYPEGTAPTKVAVTKSPLGCFGHIASF